MPRHIKRAALAGQQEEADAKRGDSRLCAIERFWGPKEQADLRVRRYGRKKRR
jgi:hypothetical protein